MFFIPPLVTPPQDGVTTINIYIFARKHLHKLISAIYFLYVDKTITILRQSDRRNSGYVPCTMEERISLVWPLTCEAVSLGKKYDVEQRLQRHIINIIRKKS